MPTAPNTIARFSTYVDPHPEGGPQYRPLVPRVDADGNDLAGIRLPAVAAPRATFTGWTLYADPFPAGALCDREGSQLPFARTRAERQAAGDPRPALEERYPDPDAYLAAVTKAVDALVADRLRLREDGDRMVASARGEASPCAEGASARTVRVARAGAIAAPPPGGSRRFRARRPDRASGSPPPPRADPIAAEGRGPRSCPPQRRSTRRSPRSPRRSAAASSACRACRSG